MSEFADRLANSMYAPLWTLITRWLKAPKDAPTIPAGAGDAVESFKPAPGFLRYLMFWFWIVLAITDIALVIVWIVICVANLIIGLVLLLPFIVLIFAPDIIAFIAIHLRYDSTWYVMTNRSIRIRRGIWSIRETTITFENVQNVKVRQGPLQRHYGIADVIIETAGAGAGAHGSAGGVTNQGMIEGVSDATRVRDVILARLKQSKSAGLGDEAHPGARASASGARAAWSAADLRALAAVRDEARSLAEAARRFTTRRAMATQPGDGAGPALPPVGS